MSTNRLPPFREELPELQPSVQLLSRRLRINCPHCRNPIVVVLADGENDGHCSVCGSSFEMEPEADISWAQQKLPKLGKFQLLGTIGRGAFGTVYRARDTDLDRIVAVKIPRNRQFSGQEDEDRFMREARSVAQLNHPGIVPVYEVGHSDEVPYIVAEYVEGVTLNQLLGKRRLQFEESASIVAALADALAHAHGRGVIHRDLKPGNIMLERWGGINRSDASSTVRVSQLESQRNNTIRSCGRARLMDFGLARRDTGEASVTVQGQLLGTPAYMSPEQARGDVDRIDQRSDIYSLGVMLYEMLTGELPFRGASRMVIQQVIHDEAASPRKLVSHLPSDLETICLKCMEKEPAKRYQSATEVTAELTRFLSGQPIMARRISKLDRARRWCLRNPTVSSLAALLFLSMTIGLFGVVSQWRRAEANASEAAQQAVLARQNAQAAEEVAAAERIARLRAEAAEAKAETAAEEAALRAATAKRVSELLIGIYRGADEIGLQGYRFGLEPPPTESLSVQQLLDNGVRKIETELEGDPETRASLMFAIAETYFTLGELGDAERLVTASLKIFQRTNGGQPSVDMANALAALGMIRYVEGNYDQSLPKFRESVAMYDQMFGKLDPRGAKIKLFFGFAVVESDPENRKVIQEAEDVFDEVLEIRRAQQDCPPQDLAHALMGKAIMQRVRGDHLFAMASLAEASKIMASVPSAAVYGRAMLTTLRATINLKIGQIEKGSRQVDEVIEVMTGELGKTHPIVTFLQIDFAKYMFDAGQIDRGKALMDQGITASRNAYGRQPRTAAALYAYGRHLMKHNADLPQAESLLAEACEIFAETLGREHVRTQLAEQIHADCRNMLASSGTATDNDHAGQQ